VFSEIGRKPVANISGKNSDKKQGRKKTARLAGGFSGILGAFRALTPLSIRQRSEMPEKIKIKLGGHGEIEVAGQKG
jgi:hypothetical protein